MSKKMFQEQFVDSLVEFVYINLKEKGKTESTEENKAKQFSNLLTSLNFKKEEVNF